MATCTICSATLTSDPASVSGPYGESVPNSTLLESRLSAFLGLTLCTRHFISMVEGNDSRALAPRLTDLKNSAASALSGTQKDIEIDIGGVPHYYTVYPTKA
ncbi:hypothetical protein LCGC14_2729870 [marine sediment metagenome]|uniref:Uncharacterized protein n=1 Tax=marine sediment metagenome TaxID=412755 RepID=A0A0F8Z7Q8_9ZZZZ